MKKNFDFFKKISKNKIFDNFITIVILLAGIVVGLQTFPSIVKSYGSLLKFIDELILFIFVVEILINVLAEGKRPWRFFYDSWHVFDFVIVALCFMPLIFPDSNTQFFAVFRLARILRLAKIFEKINNLKILLLSLMRSIPKMSYVLLLLLLLFYIYGVIATDLFGKSGEEFSSIWLSMKHLIFVAFEGWSWIYELEGVQFAMKNGMPDWAISLFFISFLFISAMIFLNLFIGIITSDMESIKEEEKRGKNKIHRKNHTLILGWSLSVFKIIEELIEANDSKESATIVILADREKEDMDFEIREAFSRTGTTKIICRSGSPFNVADLMIVNAWKSKSIIILSDQTDIHSDLYVLKSIIALINHVEQDANEFHILAEMQNKKMIKTAKTITNGRAVFFESEDFIARLIAQTSLQPHLSTIYSEVTGFQGSEFYIVPLERELESKTYRDAVFSYPNSCPIGVIRNGEVLINPHKDEKLTSNDKLIILAEDDASIKYFKQEFSIDKSKILTNEVKKLGSKNIVILGSNSKLPKIIKEINDYLTQPSTLKVITSQEHSVSECIEFLQKFNEVIISENSSEDRKFINYGDLDICFAFGDIDDVEILVKEINNAEQVTILSYYGEDFDEEQADSITLVTLIHLKNLARQKNMKISITAEIIDSNNYELINNPDVCDFIISSRIISSILAQLSEQRELNDVFQMLFQAKGSEIYLRPAIDYVIAGEEVIFATLLHSALEKNETAIGYMKVSGKVEFSLNPHKNDRFKICEKDKLIVLAED